jgi:O-antigen/teichoic acid export membrane protein
MTKLKTNLSYSVAYQILNIILPLITAPYIARVLGLTGVGLYSYSFAIMNNFQILAMLGITNYGSRTIAFAITPMERSKRFWEIYTIQCFSHIILGLLYVSYACSNFCVNYNLAFIVGIGILSSLLDISWLFFGLEEFKLTVIRNFSIKIVTTVFIFLFVKDVNDLSLYAAIMALGTLVSQSYLWFYIRRYIKWITPSLDLIRKNIKPILVLFIPILSFSVYKILSKIILGAMSTVEEVGLFENASKLLNVPLSFISAVGAVMMPRISTLLKEKNIDKVEEFLGTSIKMNTIIMSCLTFGLIATSNYVTLILFGDEFKGSSPILSILSASLLFIAWSSIIRTQWLIPSNRNQIYVISTIGGAIINIISNLFLIPIWGGIGAAISSVLSESFIFFSYLFFMKKYKISCGDFVRSIPYIICGIIMLFTICLYISEMKSKLANLTLLISSILVGIVVYTIQSFLYVRFRDKQIYHLILRIVKK